MAGALALLVVSVPRARAQAPAAPPAAGVPRRAAPPRRPSRCWGPASESPSVRRRSWAVTPRVLVNGRWTRASGRRSIRRCRSWWTRRRAPRRPRRFARWRQRPAASFPATERWKRGKRTVSTPCGCRRRWTTSRCAAASRAGRPVRRPLRPPVPGRRRRCSRWRAPTTRPPAPRSRPRSPRRSRPRGRPRASPRGGWTRLRRRLTWPPPSPTRGRCAGPRSSRPLATARRVLPACRCTRSRPPRAGSRRAPSTRVPPAWPGWRPSSPRRLRRAWRRPARRAADLPSVVIDADVTEPGAVGALLKSVREVGAVSGADLLRVGAGRVEIRARTRSSAAPLAAALSRDADAMISLTDVQPSGDVIRLRARLRAPAAPEGHP